MRDGLSRDPLMARPARPRRPIPAGASVTGPSRYRSQSLTTRTSGIGPAGGRSRGVSRRHRRASGGPGPRRPGVRVRGPMATVIPQLIEVRSHQGPSRRQKAGGHTMSRVRVVGPTGVSGESNSLGRTIPRVSYRCLPLQTQQARTLIDRNGFPETGASERAGGFATKVAHNSSRSWLSDCTTC